MPTLLSSSFKPHPFLTGSRSPGGALGPQTLVGPRGFRCVGSAPTRRVESDSFGPGRGFASGFHIDAAARYSWYKARSSPPVSRKDDVGRGDVSRLRRGVSDSGVSLVRGRSDRGERTAGCDASRVGSVAF